jgi:hypothetical protein
MDMNDDDDEEDEDRQLKGIRKERRTDRWEYWGG